MKRIGLLFVSLLLIIGNVSAQDIMVVTKKDGTVFDQGSATVTNGTATVTKDVEFKVANFVFLMYNIGRKSVVK